MGDADGTPLSEVQAAAQRERTEAALREITEFELAIRDRYAAMLETVRDERPDDSQAEARQLTLVAAGRELLPLIEERIQFLREAPDVADMAAAIHLNHTDSPARASELASVTESTAACAAALDALLRLLWELQYRTSGRRA